VSTFRSHRPLKVCRERVLLVNGKPNRNKEELRTTTLREFARVRSSCCERRELKRFYDFDQFERLVDGTAGEPQAQLVILLGGEAGFRCGEMIGLEWQDVDVDKRQVCVARSEWCGHVSVPKGGRIRYLPLTRRLAGVLKSARHLRGPRVLCDETGKPLTRKMIQVLMRRSARRANVKAGVHILRHTFCSHLAMRGAPARAIQELAGHQDLGTTQRYMHLSPAALDAAIRLLETPVENGPLGRGGIVEAQGTGA
jgi:integrase